MKEENLEALHANIDILITGLYVCHVFEWKGNFTDPTVWNTGETGAINAVSEINCNINELKVSLLLWRWKCSGARVSY